MPPRGSEQNFAAQNFLRTRPGEGRDPQCSPTRREPGRSPSAPPFVRFLAGAHTKIRHVCRIFCAAKTRHGGIGFSEDFSARNDFLPTKTYVDTSRREKSFIAEKDPKNIFLPDASVS